jgi:hypothetical protein
MGGKSESEAPNALHVFWGGAQVVVQKPAGASWQPGHVTVKATAARTTLEFSASTVGGGDGPAIGSASLSLVSSVSKVSTINGFKAANLTGPYGTAEASMLKRLPGMAKVPSSAPDCTIQASAANQVGGGAGLQLVWTAAPTAAYLKKTSSARVTAGDTVEQYLTNLGTKSMNLYSAALQSARVPEAGAHDLANSWSVEVQSISTTGSLMSFSLAISKAGVVPTWTNVPGVPSAASKAMAPTALANLLYYAKTVA